MLAELNCLLISKINVLHELQHIKDKLKMKLMGSYLIYGKLSSF